MLENKDPRWNFLNFFSIVSETERERESERGIREEDEYLLLLTK